MNDCYKTGCRNLETRCKDCGRITCSHEVRDQWVKCSERTPSEEKKYLVSMGDWVTTCVWMGIDNPERPYEYTGWRLPYDWTQWMPIPDPPEVKND